MIRQDMAQSKLIYFLSPKGYFTGPLVRDFWTKGAIITPNHSLLTQMGATVVIWSANITFTLFPPPHPPPHPPPPPPPAIHTHTHTYIHTPHSLARTGVSGFKKVVKKVDFFEGDGA